MSSEYHSPSLFHGNSVNTNRILYTPSDFAKSSLLHIQEIGYLQATQPHINRRKKLSSFLFFFVQSGSGRLTYNGTSYNLSAGSCIFIDCMQPYSHETFDDLWSLAWIHFNGPTAENIYKKYTERGGMPAFVPKDIDSYKEIYSLLYDIASNTSYTRDMEINVELASLLTLLMTDAWNSGSNQTGTKRSGIDEVKSYLDENYSKKITLDELAERYYINKFYLTRVFKEQYGVSIMDYLLGVRITNAKSKLRFTDLSAEEIGLACGIGDIYYFSRVFKKVEGISLREYRKSWGYKE